MSTHFPHLFSPLTIRGIIIKNRILSTGHMTTLVTAGNPNESLIAYHEARAKGGAGLIFIEVATVHESATFTTHTIDASREECIPGYTRIAEAFHAYDCRVFGQLFHPGRENFESVDGSAPVSYAPSAMPNERFHVMPRAMSRELIHDVVEGYGAAAARMKRAGLDGVEIVASHGYLPAQFLNPRVNVRKDDYGGSLANRLRFVREVSEQIRATVGDDFVVGLRISADELEYQGLTADEVIAVCVNLDSDNLLDYFSTIAGSSAGISGSVHIVPPMSVRNAYVVPYAAAIKAKVSIPVFVGGRINQPQEAERALATGQADMCAMTRAMICDPEMPNKAHDGRIEDIRACVGCNQACIGHMHLGYPISCIQHPESGREMTYGQPKRVEKPRKVLVAGGGPAGMKAAAVAAERGHDVTLYEQSNQLGGQVLLAQLLPGRLEFGGVVTNLLREIELTGVKVVMTTRVTAELIERQAPDAVIVATGAVPYLPPIKGEEEGHVVNAWQVLKNEVQVGTSVLVADWRCDWIGLGLAEKLCRGGCRVRLAVNGNMAGQTIQQFVRDPWIAELHRLGVEIITYARLYGVDSNTAYLQHTTSGEPIIYEDVDTVVLALGHQSVTELEQALTDFTGEVFVIGDCLAPRTVEEAILEGLKAGTSI
jgi:2,4-dienoyl-CoA reductase-like NADH-dependent reductase (Old Yellow Enzyme family)/thioredoxin reductase